MLKEAGDIRNTVALISQLIQCSHLMYTEVARVLPSSVTQGQPQIIFDPDDLPDYLFIPYDYGQI